MLELAEDARSGWLRGRHRQLDALNGSGGSGGRKFKRETGRVRKVAKGMLFGTRVGESRKKKALINVNRQR